MKTITISDILSDSEIQECIDLYKQLKDTGTFAKTVCEKIITPKIGEINLKLGQENDPKYLAYAVEYVLSCSSK